MLSIDILETTKASEFEEVFLDIKGPTFSFAFVMEDVWGESRVSADIYGSPNCSVPRALANKELSQT